MQQMRTQWGANWELLKIAPEKSQTFVDLGLFLIRCSTSQYGTIVIVIILPKLFKQQGKKRKSNIFIFLIRPEQDRRHKNKTNGRSSKSDPTSVQDGEAGFLSRPDLRRGSEQSPRRHF